MILLLIALLAPPTHPAVAEAQAILAAEAGKGPAVDSERWPERAAWARALHADCPQQVDRIAALKPNGPGRDAETRLRRLAEAQQRCKTSAAQTLKRLAIDYPRPDDDVRGLSPDERRARARALERQGDYAAARNVWRRLGNRDDRFEIARLGLKRFRSDFMGTADQFAALSAGNDDLAADAAYFHAKSLGRLGKLDAAMAAYDSVIDRFPTHKRAADARFFKAFSLYESARQPAGAAERRVAHRKASKAFAAIEDKSWLKGARWYALWTKYLAGDATAADFDAFAADAKPGSQAWRKALYWAARLDLPWHYERSAERFATLLTDRALDWYGLLILRDFPTLVPHPPIPAAPVSVPSTLRRSVAEVRALVAADLMWFARQRFAELRPRLRKVDALGLEGQLAIEVGDAEDTLRHALVKHIARLRHAPRPEDAAAWRAAWPLAYPAEIAAASARSKVPPALIHAFIRKESAYAPDAVSKAHAKGLMQLIPRTARRIQADRALDPKSIDLHDPKTNIELGTWYVGALAARYGGQLPIVMAAFNAGPAAVTSWKGAQTDLDCALWVEMIPFLQAREYVKRLTASLVVYGLVKGDGTVGELAGRAIPQRVDLANDQGGVAY